MLLIPSYSMYTSCKMIYITQRFNVFLHPSHTIRVWLPGAVRAYQGMKTWHTVCIPWKVLVHPNHTVITPGWTLIGRGQPCSTLCPPWNYRIWRNVLKYPGAPGSALQLFLPRQHPRSTTTIRGYTLFTGPTPFHARVAPDVTAWRPGKPGWTFCLP